MKCKDGCGLNIPEFHSNNDVHAVFIEYQRKPTDQTTKDEYKHNLIFAKEIKQQTEEM